MKKRELKNHLKIKYEKHPEQIPNAIARLEKLLADADELRLQQKEEKRRKQCEPALES